MIKPNDYVITIDRLKYLLKYTPEDGIFTWNIGRQKAKAGSIAGCNVTRGYRMICIDGVKYLAHRLAWFYEKETWPEFDIDHINGCTYDNRIENLRDVNRSINKQNTRKATSRNKLGFLGVSKNGKRFTAHIKINGKHSNLGQFDTPEEAHEAYLLAKRIGHAGCTI